MKARHPDAAFVAGGTDLALRARRPGAELPNTLISLRAVKELTEIEVDARVRLGAAVPLGQIARHPAIGETFPALVEAIAAVGSPQIRNVASLGGNLCNASPAADTAPALLVSEAQLELRSATAQREVAMADFFVGPGQTVAEPDEILTAVVLQPPGVGERSTFVRRGRVAMDLAIASVAVSIAVEQGCCRLARIAVGAVAPVPKRLPTVEALLVGSELDAETLGAVRPEATAAIAPISHVRAGADYRRELVGVLLERAVCQLAGRAVS